MFLTVASVTVTIIDAAKLMRIWHFLMAKQDVWLQSSLCSKQPFQAFSRGEHAQWWVYTNRVIKGKGKQNEPCSLYNNILVYFARIKMADLMMSYTRLSFFLHAA